MSTDKKRINRDVQAYMDASGDGFWDWYIQEDYEYMSPRFWEMFGYLPEEKPHKPSAWMDIIFEEDLAAAKVILNRHFETRGERPYEQEVRYHHKNGTTVTVLCRGSVVEWGDAGEPIRMLGTHTDISGLKRAEAELKEAKERYDLAFKGSAVGLWDWNIENSSLYWSERLKQMLQIEDEHFQASFDDYLARLHPDEKQEMVDAINQHLRQKTPYEYQFRLRRNDDTYIWVLARGQALWNECGEAVRMAGSLDDITTRKNNELALQKSLDFQKLLMNTNTDLFLVKDEQFRIVEANTAFLNLYPESLRDKVIGYTTIESYDDAQAREYLKEDKKAFDEGFSEVMETIDFPDGEQRILQTKKIRFEDVSGNPFILGVARDITNIKKAEQDLKQLNEQLEEFAYRTSHDLRSPLISSAKLLGIIHELMQKEDYAKCLQYILIARDSIHSLEALVTDILTLAKINHGSEPLESLNIKVLIDRCLNKFSHLDGFDNVQFNVDDQYHKEIIVQKDQITLVVENLVTNAIKYQDRSKDQSIVSISIEQMGQYLQLSVSDNGIGIPQHSHKHLFTMFKRFHSGVSFGSGLGLYMVKKSVDKLGGGIEYIDTGEGSKFIVCLPLKNLRGKLS